MTQTAYQLACALYTDLGIPSFPVRVEWDADKARWKKMPLVKWGGVTRDMHPREFNWRHATAVGVPMGSRSGLFAFDLDDYKPGSKAVTWVEDQGLPPTRTHKTVSGGTHLIYRMPATMRLGNSAPMVHGLDVRGDGGFIVWGDELGLYEVVDDQAPVDLPPNVIDLLVKLNSGAGRFVHDADVPNPKYVDDHVFLPKLRALLNDPLRNRDLVDRFAGSRAGLKDESRSAMDMSVASLLARTGFTYDEIVAVLLHHFEHGKSGRDGWTDSVERECCRCAWRAVSQREENEQAFVEQMAVKATELGRLLQAREAIRRGARQ